MSRALFVLLAVVLAIACVLPSPAVAKTAVIGGRVTAESKQMTAKVVGVDMARHQITLQMSNGKVMKYKAANLKNLSMLKKGDTVTATVVEALAVYLEKGGGAPAVSKTTTLMVAPKGAGPAEIMANTVQVTGKVQYVDTKNRTITVTGPDYKSHTFKVSKSITNMSKVKVGDDVVIRYTEAIALSVRKPMR